MGEDETAEEISAAWESGIKGTVINYGFAYCAVRDLVKRADAYEVGNHNGYPIAVGMTFDELEGLRFALRYCFSDDVKRMNAP